MSLDMLRSGVDIKQRSQLPSLSFQTKEFTFPVIDQVQEKLKDMKLWDSSILSERSIIIEPKDMTIDQLKAQLEADN